MTRSTSTTGMLTAYQAAKGQVDDEEQEEAADVAGDEVAQPKPGKKPRMPIKTLSFVFDQKLDMPPAHPKV